MYAKIFELEVLMKNFVSGVILVLLAGVFGSCTSAPTAANPYRPLSGFPNANIIGTVQTTFKSNYYIPDSRHKEKVILSLSEAAYIALLAAAKQEYSGNIDIVDISWV